MSESERLVLVTGASRGIGKAIAISLGEKGYSVIGSATSQSGAKAITEYLLKLGISGRGISFDVKDINLTKKAIKEANGEFGDFDILINNAGITRDNLLMRLSDEDWSDVINTNLSGVFKLTKFLIRPMIKKRFGRIINITSIVGHIGNAGQANYAASKSGLIGFSKSLAKEVASRGVTVNCIAPGFIETDMTNQLTDIQRNNILNQIPVGRLGSVRDIVGAIQFLVEDTGSYITGSSIHVNGGMFME